MFCVVSFRGLSELRELPFRPRSCLTTSESLIAGERTFVMPFSEKEFAGEFFIGELGACSTFCFLLSEVVRFREASSWFSYSMFPRVLTAGVRGPFWKRML